jgi:hypothetical protein
MPCGLHVILRTINLHNHSLVSLFIEIDSMSFSTTGKSIRRSRSHSVSDLAVSNAVSYASIVDFVKIVCLQDF